MRYPFPILGLTGGIGAGKSFVADLLRKRGWVILDADLASRRVVEPGTDGLRTLVDAFGAGILGSDGALDRTALGGQIFSDPGGRKRLEALLHPRILGHLEAEMANLPPDTHGVVLDAALWVEIGQGHRFDELWVVEAPEALRLGRITARDGLSEEEVRRRLRAQASDAERRLHADLTVLNDGRELTNQLAEAETQLVARWSHLRAERWRQDMEAPFTPEQMGRILEALLSRGGDYGELFFEQRKACALGMDDGRMEDVLASETFGASLRLIEDEATRFADLISPEYEELLEAAHTLAAPGKGRPAILPLLTQRDYPSPSPIERDPATVPLPEKVALVRRAEAIAREHGETLRPGAVRQVAVGYGDSTQRVWIASAERQGEDWIAELHSDRRIQGIFRLNVTAGEGDNLQMGYQPLGETRGFELFTEEAVRHTAQEAVRLAIQALDAQPAPAGTLPVILSSSAGGTMIHEACGHGLEADLALAGMSAFAGKLGERVAAEGVTIIDDGTLPHKRGSSAIDDEGQPTQRVVLVENGILKAYLQSRKTARKMGTHPSGNGRRESYRHIPIPRMRNTFLAPGGESPEAILKDLDRGLLVKRMGGGQVDTVTGNFVFQVTEGYWVEKGEIRYPVKNATLSGCGPEVLRGLVRIGNDLEHFDIGTCGKDGQGVPVSDALPTILCPSLVVGGTAQLEEAPMIRFKLQLGDITTQEADAIVNSTDTTLLDGGPVHQAVHRVGGPDLTMECEVVGNCPVGEARLTGGHNLPAKLVIHTVAPTWLDGHQGEREQLASCYQNALRLAEVRRVTKLAFPSLGAGRQPQIPLEEAAPVAVRTILEFLDRHDYPDQVVLVCYDRDTFMAYQKALKSALP